MAAGLPVEGTVADDTRVGSAARSDVATCGLDDPVDGLDGPAIVVDGNGVVHGVVGPGAAQPGAQAEDVMTLGPSTFRPNVPRKELADWMDRHDKDAAIITTLDGRLVGVVQRPDLG